MTHPLRTWLKANDISVKEFSKDRPFSYVTVYKILSGDDGIRLDTLFQVSQATAHEVPIESMIAALKRKKASTGEAA